MEILVRQQYTKRQINVAEARLNEFRPSRYTSGSANLDNMVELGKAVLLCVSHTRKFEPKKARYLAHPDKKMRRVVGNCDVCQETGLNFLFLNEQDAVGELRKVEKFKRTLEYGRFFTG